MTAAGKQAITQPSGIAFAPGLMSPSSSSPSEEEDLAGWGLARIKDLGNQISESIDVPTLLLMQAAFLLGLILKDVLSFDTSSFFAKLLFEATSKTEETI